jgi:hypothetical protein
MENDNPRRGRGRPTRAEASRKATELLAEAGINVTDIDPRLILKAIAADVSAPASARVSACRKLIDDEIETKIREANDRATDIW